MIRKSICVPVFLWTVDFSAFRETDDTPFTEIEEISSMLEYQVFHRLGQNLTLKSWEIGVSRRKWPHLKFEA